MVLTVKFNYSDYTENMSKKPANYSNGIQCFNSYRELIKHEVTVVYVYFTMKTIKLIVLIVDQCKRIHGAYTSGISITYRCLYVSLLLENPFKKSWLHPCIYIVLQSSAHACIIEDHNCHIIYKIVTKYLLMIVLISMRSALGFPRIT